MWTANSMTKVFRGDEAAAGSTLRLEAARNEHVAGQIVLRPTERAVQGLTLTTTDLEPMGADARAGAISAAEVALRLVDYVYLPAPGRSDEREPLETAKAKHYPDALIPIEAVGPIDLEPGVAQPVWVSLVVPRETPAGIYKGEIEIHSGGQILHSAAIVLRVWGFTLADRPTVRSVIAGGLSREDRDGKAGEDMRRRYYEFWLERRLSPQRMPAELDSSRAVAWYRDPRLSAFRIGSQNRANHLERHDRLVDLWRRHGVLDKAVLRSVDEPKRKAEFDRIARLTRSHPHVEQIVCFNRGVPGGWADGQTFFEILGDALGIWCPILNLYSNDEIRREARARQDRGDEAWWYVCSWPKPPYPTFFVDGRGIEPRIMFWMKWLYRVDGFLHWGGARWQGKNPYETAAVRDKWPNLYGDGYLLYPGDPVGYDGPVTSIRLEAIRDGIEDHMYLTELTKHGKQSMASAIAGRLVDSLRDYTRNPDELLALRRVIGRWLERNAQRSD